MGANTCYGQQWTTIGIIPKSNTNYTNNVSQYQWALDMIPMNNGQYDKYHTHGQPK